MLSHEDQIVAAIRQIIRAVDLHSRRLVEQYGLTGPQLAVLQEVERLGTAAPKQLACSVHLSQATVTGILKRLTVRGLVDRQPSPADRRSVTITMTAAGRQLLQASPSLMQDRFRQALSSLEAWERTQILATLQRVGALMDADALDAAPHLTPGDIDVAGGGRAGESL
ncbi:MarR family winged helix-turn-helix transcriptional regulator [Roseimaritima sediminicola]|uniref:MarR family winged helix-turn-helix transcriptional regulator n=1 Tax=Roseimaritima sediminicola TaxID=2662066 RepID=UPI00192A64CF|nr:MarR family transcriptional regulator [Roseimaritima sediminicola]